MKGSRLCSGTDPDRIESLTMASFLDSVPFSGIIRIRDMMYSVKDPFRLDQGDVSFDAPDTVKRAMHRAIDENTDPLPADDRRAARCWNCWPRSCDG